MDQLSNNNILQYPDINCRSNTKVNYENNGGERPNSLSSEVASSGMLFQWFGFYVPMVIQLLEGNWEEKSGGLDMHSHIGEIGDENLWLLFFFFGVYTKRNKFCMQRPTVILRISFFCDHLIAGFCKLCHSNVILSLLLVVHKVIPSA